jgi:glycosyltransferase involved in cell wall biosynthesis/2-polyprenyl-3-methyl-5-hydroxy-6-metoxy-1,4-benzoquinol methylase
MTPLMRPPILCLTIYPVSEQYKQMVENTAGQSVAFKQITDLRQLGKLALIKYLLSNTYKTIILPCEVPETTSVLPILQLLAAAHRLPRIVISSPEAKFSRVPYYRIALESIGLVSASIDGWRARKRCMKQVRRLAHTRRSKSNCSTDTQRILYIKNNTWFGIRAGGSVGHVAGVINALSELGHVIAFSSPESPKYLNKEVDIVPIQMFGQFAIPPEANLFRIHERSVAATKLFAKSFAPTMIYQRLSIGDFAGAQLADELGIPLIVEYNASEVWVVENWGRKLHYMNLCIQAEDAMLNMANLVFTISEPLQDELLNRGIQPHRIHWYPNCVDSDIYDSNRWTNDELRATRKSFGATDDSFVLTFVGTFGQWHGAEVLAEAAVLLSQDQEWKSSTQIYILFIGDGLNQSLCKEIIRDTAAEKFVHFAGLLPQHITPKYMAASDAFVAPHVPNTDGTKFFGSPTKLFEYMAMGKPIVASRLDQLADILEDGETAYLVEPGDAQSLATGIRRMLDDTGGRETISHNALSIVRSDYTWTRHVTEIIDAIDRSCASSSNRSLSLPQFNIAENVYGSLERLKWIWEHTTRFDNPRIAEFGCGTGLMVTVPLRLAGLNVHGWDIHEPSIRFGQELAESWKFDPECLQVGDFFEQPENSMFDIIIATEVLEHVDDGIWDSTVAQLLEQLTSEGTLLITVPNGWGGFELEAFLWRTIKKAITVAHCWPLANPMLMGAQKAKRFILRRSIRDHDFDARNTLADSGSPHVQFFTRKKLCKRLEALGAQCVDSQGTGLVAGPFSDGLLSGFRWVTSLNNWLGKHVGPCSAGFRMAFKVDKSPRS